MSKFNKLSRAEMKNVLGGDGEAGLDPVDGGGGASVPSCKDECSTGSQCSSGSCILARCSNGTFFICQ